MKRLYETLTTCVAMALLSAPAYAATQTQMDQAENLLEVAKPIEALALLEGAHNPSTASVQEFFLLGVSAKMSAKFSKAEGYLREALVRNPNAGRIRMELADVLFRQSKLDASRAELLAVQSLNPPETVRQNIDGLIARIDAVKANPNRKIQGPQKNWSAYVTTGFTSDSNVNAGPNTDTVLLYGLPFTLSSAAQETRDGTWFVRVGGKHQFQMDNGVVWRSGVQLAFSNYFSADAYDTTTLSVTSGPSFNLRDKVGLSIPIAFDIQSYNEQGGWYSQSWGIAPNLQYKIQDNLQFYLSASASRKRFNGDHSRSLNAYTFNPSINFQTNKNGNVTLGLQYGRENSETDIYSNTVRGAHLGYEHTFSGGRFKTSVTASLTSTQFDGIQAAHTQAREDLSRKLSASVTYTIPKMDGISLQGSLSHQDNNSNLGINTYERTQFSLSLTNKF